MKVKPKAREEKVEKIDISHYIVHTKNLPEKGRANEGVIRLLASYFSLPKSNIVIISGKTSRLKVVNINT
ncbi:MAG: DUF167 domain-containing protein [bacterium]